MCQLGDLGLDVMEVGVARPAPKLPDEAIRIAVEFEVHGTSRAQAVGADAGEVEPAAG